MPKKQVNIRLEEDLVKQLSRLGPSVTEVVTNFVALGLEGRLRAIGDPKFADCPLHGKDVDPEKLMDQIENLRCYLIENEESRLRESGQQFSQIKSAFNKLGSIQSKTSNDISKLKWHLYILTTGSAALSAVAIALILYHYYT